MGIGQMTMGYSKKRRNGHFTCGFELPISTKGRTIVAP